MTTRRQQQALKRVQARVNECLRQIGAVPRREGQTTCDICGEELSPNPEPGSSYVCAHGDRAAEDAIWEKWTECLKAAGFSVTEGDDR
jgi:hypothetical protein